MRLMPAVFICLLFFSCKTGEKRPDISGISAPLKTYRFEQELFAADSTRLPGTLEQLKTKNPEFYNIFINNILNADLSLPQDSTIEYVHRFLSYYKSLNDSVQLLYKDFDIYEKEVSTSFRYLKYYFPKYKLPNQIITYVGPLDGYGDILTNDAIIIGLHHHLGGGSAFYKAGWLQDTYPAYLTARFDPEHIAVNSIRNIINDMYPDNPSDERLIQQMIAAGKKLYLLQKCLPDYDENILIGYDKEQLKDCYQHEAVIWNYFIQNNMLQSINKNLTKDYVSESPKTPELGEKAPGNIGSFTGWQIVKKYMKEHEDVSPEKLMQLSADLIMKDADYKP